MCVLQCVMELSPSMCGVAFFLARLFLMVFAYMAWIYEYNVVTASQANQQPQQQQQHQNTSYTRHSIRFYRLICIYILWKIRQTLFSPHHTRISIIHARRFLSMRMYRSGMRKLHCAHTHTHKHNHTHTLARNVESKSCKLTLRNVIDWDMVCFLFGWCKHVERSGRGGGGGGEKGGVEEMVD